jgi:hypothetical protein
MADKRKRSPTTEADISSVLADPMSGLPVLAERFESSMPSTATDDRVCPNVVLTSKR